MRKCVRCRVSGRVQGVWFRAAAREQALSLGVAGWAANLADGRVEVLACGGETELAELCEWLRRGPPLAQVERVEISDEDWQPLHGFDTR